MSEVHPVPLAEIADDALPRDRTGLDPEPLRELRDSILASGLRQPVELFPLAEPRGDLRYGIVSGFRRVKAFRELLAMGIERFAAVPAFLLPARDLAQTLAAMVEENEIRAALSPYEQGRIAMFARDQDLFPTIEEAVDRLYPAANRMKRSRLRAIAHVAECLDDVLTAPEKLSLRQLVRIGEACRHGFAEVMAAALDEASLKDPDTQWQLLQPYLAESERSRSEEPEPAPSAAPGTRRRPIRLSRPRYGLVIRRELIRDGWRLNFTGPEAKSALMDRVIEEIEAIFTPVSGLPSRRRHSFDEST
jgi:ParB family chromosome partitioning protein